MPDAGDAKPITNSRRVGLACEGLKLGLIRANHSWTSDEEKLEDQRLSFSPKVRTILANLPVPRLFSLCSQRHPKIAIKPPSMQRGTKCTSFAPVSALSAALWSVGMANADDA